MYMFSDGDTTRAVTASLCSNGDDQNSRSYIDFHQLVNKYDQNSMSYIDFHHFVTKYDQD